MMATARIMKRLITCWGILNTLRMGMGCLLAGALLHCVGEVLVPTSVLGFIPPMWLAGVGIATAVSVTPNGAFQGFDHIAGVATAVYFFLGDLECGFALDDEVARPSRQCSSALTCSPNRGWPRAEGSA